MGITKKSIVKKALELAGSLVGAARLLDIPTNDLKRLVIRHKITWPPKENLHGTT